MIGPFGMEPRGTMRVRALPMAQALVGRGHTVSILLPPWQNPEAAGDRREEGGVSIENVHLPPAIPGLFHGMMALRLARRALALRPDVVHLFKPKAYSGLVHWLLACVPRGHRPRVVVDADDWEGPGGWNELGDYAPLQRHFFAWQERWGLTHADAITVASRTLESLVWAMGVPPECVHYVPNGVLQDGPRAQSEGRGQGANILLYTRFFEFPVSRVIDLVQLVRAQVPQAQLLIVGKGLFGEEEELFRLAAEAGLGVARPSSSPETELMSPHLEHAFEGVSDRSTPSPRPTRSPSAEVRPSTPSPITYAGWVPSDDLPCYFARADVAIYPFDDTLVNRAKCAVKLIDLLAAGVPVVAEAVGQNREYIRSGETGLLVEPGDLDAFAKSVIRLLQSPLLRRSLGRTAARDVQERFNWQRLVETVERAYGSGR